MSSHYTMHGMVNKVAWPNWPMGLDERFPVAVGDKVLIKLEYVNNPPEEYVNYNVKIQTSTGPLSWDSGPLSRSDYYSLLEGVFPAITCSQKDFLNPWTPTNGSFEHSDESLIILKMKHSGEKSVGIIESQGWFTTLANEQLYVVFTIEYSFDSGIP